jgi:hypothetical protein
MTLDKLSAFQPIHFNIAKTLPCIKFTSTGFIIFLVMTKLRDMRSQSLLLLFSTMAVVVRSKPSTLKVAVCSPGQAPYAVTLPNGTLAGFDVGISIAFFVGVSDFLTQILLTQIYGRVHIRSFVKECRQRYKIQF